MRRLIKKYLLLICLIILSTAGANASTSPYDEYIPSSNEKVYEKNSYRYSAIDPTLINNWAGSGYPGMRGSNQLVIYTPVHGISTNTNEYGAEAIVEGNTVTSLSGADSLIPSNGIVISAHGRAKTWLNQNIHVGTKIYIDTDTKTITAFTTSQSYIFAAQEKIEEASTMVNYYSHNTYGYNPRPTKELIYSAKRNLRKAHKNSLSAKEYAQEAMQNANDAIATAIPYKSNELKGIWIRPTENTEEGIIAVLDKLKNSGINNIFLETYFHGKTIFPSKTMTEYGFIEQNEIFKDFDPLKIWIDEAHKRNIKINIWFEAFYIGNKPQTGKSILAVKPEWSNINLRNIDTLGPVSSTSEHNGYFLDPANTDVQVFLYKLVGEIIETYHPDGFNFDYCRYPQSIAARYAGYAQSNWGYTKCAREEFKNIYGVDPVEISYGSKSWTDWDNYRRDKVTLFISKVSKLCRDNNTIITAVVFPNRIMALETKQQDWSAWSDSNYVDAFTPLYLTCDAKTIKVMIYDMLKDMSPKTKLYAGLFVTFMNGTSEDLIRQIHETRKLNLGGIILFDYAHLQDKYIKTLTKSVFSNNNSSIVQAGYKRKK
ncbi:family 10 glycosylhydrolase [bacterium]|nr:family 10 glycosylhydrolase [bacterium]